MDAAPRMEDCVVGLALSLGVAFGGHRANQGQRVGTGCFLAIKSLFPAAPRPRHGPWPLGTRSARCTHAQLHDTRRQPYSCLRLACRARGPPRARVRAVSTPYGCNRRDSCIIHCPAAHSCTAVEERLIHSRLFWCAPSLAESARAASGGGTGFGGLLKRAPFRRMTRRSRGAAHASACCTTGWRQTTSR